MRKIKPYKICKFCINLFVRSYYAREDAPDLEESGALIFSWYKICKLRKAIFSAHFTTSDLATKLCNFTNFNMLFLAVVMDFVLLA